MVGIKHYCPCGKILFKGQRKFCSKKCLYNPNFRSGENNPMFGKRGKDSPAFGRKWKEESKDKLRRFY